MNTRPIALLSAISMVASLLVIAPPPAAADTHNVVATYPELLDALDAVGDIELIAGMTLDAPVTIARDVAIYGSESLAEQTIVITAPNGSPAFVIASGATAAISKLAVTGASDRKAKGGAFGVEAGAYLTLNAVSVYGNTAGEGAGLYNAGTTAIENSVFYSNDASGKGGAISNDGTLAVVNSTFAKNSAQQGGAISTAGAASFNFVTIVGNSSKNKIGAGTHITGGSIDLDNSIVANNYSGGSFYDCSGQTDVNRVLFSSTQGCQPSGNLDVDYKVVPVITFPASEVPQENGGPTKTVALIDQTSPAPLPAENFDHPASGFGVACVATDQRGVSRPATACDIGAFEREFLPPVVTLTASPAPDADGWNDEPVTVTITVDEPSTIEYSFDDVSYLPYRGPFDIAEDGTGILVYARATDIEGNLGTATLSPPLDIDLTPPTASADAQLRPDGGWDVTISASDALSGLASITVDGVPMDPGLDGTVTLPPITEAGTTTINFFATDIAGNSSVSEPIEVEVVPLMIDISDFTAEPSSVEVGAVSVPLQNLSAASVAAAESGTTASAQLSAIQLSAIQLSAIQLSAIDWLPAQLSAIQLSAIEFLPAQLSAIQLSAIQLSAINLSDIQLSAIAGYPAGTQIDDLLCDAGTTEAPESTDYCGIPLQALTLVELIEAEPGITLADVDFRSTQLSAIQLSAIVIAQLPLEVLQLSPDATVNKGLWCEVLGLDTDGCNALDMGEDSLLDLASTQLSAIQLSAIQLSAIQLSAIQLSAIQLSAIASLTSTQLSAIQLSAIQLSAIEWASTQLSAIQLSAIQLSAIEWLSTQLSAIQLSAIPASAQLSAIQLSAIEWASTQLSAIEWLSTQLSATQLSAIPASAQLSAIQLSAIGCTDALCVPGLTLGSLAELVAEGTVELQEPLTLLALGQAGILDSVTLGALVESGVLDDVSVLDIANAFLTLGQLDEFGIFDDPDLTVAQLLDLFAEEPLASSGYTLLDLLFGLVPSSDMAWEELGDLASLPLADAADNTGTSREGDGAKQPTFDYLVTVDVAGPSAAVDIAVTLPQGFSFAQPNGTVADASVPYVRLTSNAVEVSNDGSILPVTFQSEVTNTCLVGEPADPTDDLVADGDLVFLDLQLAAGAHVLAIPVWAGTTLGNFDATAAACAESGTQADNAASGPASITVVDGAPSSNTIETDTVELAHISSAADIEQYTFVLDGRAQARIILTELSNDLDLVLFGPPMQAPLRQTPQVGYGLVEDFAYDLTPDDDALDPNALNDLPLTAPAGSVLHAVSANRGIADEIIDTGALRPGTYTIQVSGYNGATAAEAFALRLRTSPLPDPVCPAPLGTIEATGSTAIPTGIDTLFLYNWSTYGGDTNLSALIADPRWDAQGITPALVAIDAFGPVVTELNDWAATPCDPLAANDVVRAIGSSVLDPILAANPGLEYLVLLGDDSQIPFARMTDGVFVSNEAVHGLTLADAGTGVAGELKSAMVEGYYLSDKPYASSLGIAVADREFFVSSLATGRLVEDKANIEAVISSHLDNDGFLTDGTASGSDGSAFVAGYDFLADSAQASADALASGFSIDPLTNAEFINENWTRGQLITALDAPYSVVSVQAHFDQTRLLPANENLAGTETDLFDVFDLADRALLYFTLGCHSGLSVSDARNIPVLDWAQAALQSGSSWLGNTGYGYGDTQIVALSERLVAEFAERVGSMPIGKALVGAENEYVSSLYTITPYDIKVLEQFTLYGLPMARTVGSPSVASSAALAASGSEPVIFNDPYTGLPSSFTSLDYGSLAISDFTPAAWTAAGLDLSTVRGRAILPTETIDVSSTGRKAAGVLVTGLTSSDKFDFLDPVIFDPRAGEQYTPESSTPDFRLQSGETTFPASIQSGIKHFLGDDGAWHDRVVVAPARHYTEDGSQIEIFTDIELQTLYRPGGWDGTEAVPFIERSIGRVGNKVVHFDITVQPAAGSTVDRVLILFREESASGPWQSVDLVNVPGSNQWLGGRPPVNLNATAFEYTVQAVSNWGDRALATGKGINFDTISPNRDQGVTVDVSDPTDFPSTGWYPGRNGADVTATATSSSPLCSYVLDGQVTDIADGLLSFDIDIESDGGHLLQVFAGDDCQNPDKQGLLFVAIDGTGPALETSLQPESGFGEKTVTINAIDKFGSGVATVEYSYNGSEWITYAGPFTQITSATIYTRAFDFVGNEGSGVPVSVIVDTTPPSLTASGYEDGDSTAVYSAGSWTNAGTVTVAVVAEDLQSGVVSLLVDGSEVTAPPETANLSHEADVTSEGTITVNYQATDAIGNAADGSFEVRIDRTEPNATLQMPAGVPVGQTTAYASFTCSDALSGVDKCVVKVDGVEQSNGPTSGTVSLGATSVGTTHSVTVTTTDKAGNRSSLTRTYIVAYRICLLYDPTSAQPATGAFAVKLQLCDQHGQNLSSSTIKVKATKLVTDPANGDAGLDPQDSGKSNSAPTYEFRYDAKLKGYIYNLNQDPVLTAGSYILYFTVGTSPYEYPAPIKLK